jgi:hypothetical protein
MNVNNKEVARSTKDDSDKRELIEEVSRLDPSIRKKKEMKNKLLLVKDAVNNFLLWKQFAIDQYKLLGFSYRQGDKINLNKATQEIEKRLQADDKFIRDVYESLDISRDVSYEEALEKLRKMLPGEPMIRSVL